MTICKYTVKMNLIFLDTSVKIKSVLVFFLMWSTVSFLLGMEVEIIVDC